MSVRDKLKATLQTAGAMCDDCLSSSASVKPRQQVNARCRDLELAGEITRQNDQCPQCRSNKIVNRMRAGNQFQSKPNTKKKESQKSIVDVIKPGKPWCWEGNVQTKIVEYLESTEWEILTSANTATRESGKDIVATKSGRELWVSVKGWPERSVNTQARHWFSSALFDLILFSSFHNKK